MQLYVAMSNGSGKQLEQERLARLGCSILAQDTYRDLGSGTSIWNRLLPQLSNAIPSVKAAAAALGAIYESTMLKCASCSISKRRAAGFYGNAIHHVQRDVLSQLHGPVPLLLSCALLAFVELLRRRQFNALIHLQGALRLLRSRDQLLIQARPNDSAGATAFDATDATDVASTGLEDNLTLMFMTLDIQKASYALGQPPELSVSPQEPLQPKPSNIPDTRTAELQLVRLIHSCYHFTSQASHCKYLPRATIPPDLVFEQGRHIAKLSLWLNTLNQVILTSHDPSTDTYHHALVLRSQCLSTLVYLSTILSPHECSYDVHAPHFQRVIQDAATVLAQDSVLSSPLRQFRPCPGIVQPLFFTAIKYRHSHWRRQAIEQLRRSGREGPFDGKLLAALASRVVEIEEYGCRDHFMPNGILPEHVEEKQRVHGCGVDAEARDDDQPLLSVLVTLSRCEDVERMLFGPKSWDHASNWSIWNEGVEV